MLDVFQQKWLADCQHDIFEAIARITRYTEGLSEAYFAASVMTQDAVLFNFRVIGECTQALENQLPLLVMKQFRKLPGGFQYPMRGHVAPGCYRRRISDIWAAVKNYIPALKSQLALSNYYDRAVEVDGGLFAVQLIDGGWSVSDGPGTKLSAPDERELAGWHIPLVSDGPGTKLSAPDERELAGWHIPVRFETEAAATAAILSGPDAMFDIAYDSAWTAHCLDAGGKPWAAYGRYAH